jgi:hypothetical protein
MSDELDVYDHVRLTVTDHPDGVYRVVGTTDETVTLLRVGDPDGRRIHTGEVSAVDRAALDDAEPADNPDDSWAITPFLTGLPKSIYWQLRTFVLTLAANPIPTAIALALLVIGSLEDPGIALPEPLSTAFVFAGAFGLVYVGGGRL